MFCGGVAEASDDSVNPFSLSIPSTPGADRTEGRVELATKKGPGQTRLKEALLVLICRPRVFVQLLED